MDNEEKDVVKNDEEQEVRDNDADTRDVEETVKDDSENMSKRMQDFMDEVRARMDALDASVRSIKDAQAITIDNGAIIRDESEPQDEDYVDTRTIAELDLSI